jgi:hypothetical protein
MTSRKHAIQGRPGRGWRILLAASLLPLAGSCSDTIVTPTDVATVHVVPEQVDVTEGGTVQLSAELRDEQGRTVTGHPIAWSSTDEGIASVDAAGRVSAKVRGTTSIRAQVGAAQGTAAIRVLLPPSIGLSQHSVSLVTGSDGTAPSPIQVAITNEGEAELTGLAVASDYGGGPTGWLATSLSQATAPAVLTVAATDISGLGPGRYEATVHISASSAAGGPIPLLVSMEVRGSAGGADPPAKLAFAQHPMTTRVGDVLNPAVVVRVEDANGNLVSSEALVSLALGTNPSGAALVGTRTVTAVDGIATFGDLSIDKVGQGYRLEASSAQLTTATSSAFDITAGDPSAAALTGPASASAGQVSQAFTLRVVDDRGNTATVAANTSFALGSTATGTFFADPAGNNAITSVTIAAGGSTASFYYSGAAAGQHTISATNPTLGAAAHAITVTVGEAARLTFGQQPTTTTVDATIDPPVTVRIEDDGGNLVSSTATVTLSLGTNPSGAALGGTISRAAVNGVATFDDLSVDQVGQGYRLAASSGTLAGATSNAFDVTVGEAARLTFGQQPTTTTVDAAIDPPVTVRIEDDGGNLVSSTATVTLSLGTNPSGAALGGTVSRAAVNGIATFDDLSLNQVGEGYRLAASSGTLAGATSNAFDVTVAAAARLTFGQQPTTTTVDATIDPPVTVRIEDDGGNLVASTATVTLSLGTNPSGAALGGTVSRAAVNGVATFDDLSVDQVGQGYRLAASSGTLASATSNAFDITPARVAAQLVYGQQPTTTIVDSVIAPPVTVRIEDKDGNLVTDAGLEVTLQLAANRSGLGGTLSVTAIGGIATFDDLTIDRVDTAYRLQARAGSLEAATSDRFDIIPNPNADLAFGAPPASRQTSGTDLANGESTGIEGTGPRQESPSAGDR